MVRIWYPLEDNLFLLKDRNSLSVQLKTVRSNGVCTKNATENFDELVLKLCTEVGLLCMDTNSLQIKILSHVRV